MEPAPGPVGVESGLVSRGVLDEAVGKGAICFDGARYFLCGASGVVSSRGGKVLHNDDPEGGRAGKESDYGIRVLPEGDDGKVGFAGGPGGGYV